MNREIKNMETVLITGASRGIGLELTRQFLDRGYHVISTYRGSLADKLSTLNQNENLNCYELEVTNEKSILRLSEDLGDQTIDILINNAGITGPEKQSLETIDVQGWLDTFLINSIAPLLVSQALLSNFKRAVNPRILTISSQMGALSRERKGMFAYRSSKSAVNKVMQILSLELRDQGISVCPVHPGWVKTDMGGSGADITVEESARGIVDLAIRLTIENSGKFFTWEGSEHDW